VKKTWLKEREKEVKIGGKRGFSGRERGYEVWN